MRSFEDIQVGDYKESTEDYELTAEEIIETRLSGSQPGLGIVRSELNLTNQRGETVIEFKAAALIRQRPQES